MSILKDPYYRNAQLNNGGCPTDREKADLKTDRVLPDLHFNQRKTVLPMPAIDFNNPRILAPIRLPERNVQQEINSYYPNQSKVGTDAGTIDGMLKFFK